MEKKNVKNFKFLESGKFYTLGENVTGEFLEYDNMNGEYIFKVDNTTINIPCDKLDNAIIKGEVQLVM